MEKKKWVAPTVNEICFEGTAGGRNVTVVEATPTFSS